MSVLRFLNTTAEVVHLLRLGMVSFGETSYNERVSSGSGPSSTPPFDVDAMDVADAEVRLTCDLATVCGLTVPAQPFYRNHSGRSMGLRAGATLGDLIAYSRLADAVAGQVGAGAVLWPGVDSVAAQVRRDSMRFDSDFALLWNPDEVGAARPAPVFDLFEGMGE